MPFIGSRVALKSGSEVLTRVSDGTNGSLSFTPYSLEDTREDIVFYVPSALNNVYVQACTRQFVTIDTTGKIGLKAVGSTISQEDTFNFVCLGMNIVAIQASNGKFVIKSGTGLIADKTTIGDTEKFEVIIVFC